MDLSAWVPLGWDVIIGLATNFLAALVGVLVAIYVRDRWYYRRLFEGWEVRILYDDREALPGGRSIGWATAKAITESTAEESVLLKGIVSPYARLHCDLITEGRDKGILIEVDEPRRFLGRVRGKRRTYTIDLSRGEAEKLLAIEPLTRRILGIEAPGEKSPSLAGATDVARSPSSSEERSFLLNFSHPLASDHLAAIERLTGQAPAEVRDEPTQTRIDNARPLAEQVTAIVDNFGLSPRQWQTGSILINPPGYAPATAAVLAELHGRMGHFPALLRLRPVGGDLRTFEVAEIVDLNKVREAARARRGTHKPEK